MLAMRVCHWLMHGRELILNFASPRSLPANAGKLLSVVERMSVTAS